MRERNIFFIKNHIPGATMRWNKFSSFDAFLKIFSLEIFAIFLPSATNVRAKLKILYDLMVL